MPQRSVTDVTLHALKTKDSCQQEGLIYDRTLENSKSRTAGEIAIRIIGAANEMGKKGGRRCSPRKISWGCTILKGDEAVPESEPD